MKIEVLMSCMHQSDAELAAKSHITGDVVIINQCDRNEEFVGQTSNGTVRMFSTTDRGLTKSRNMAIDKSDGDVCLICDDDEVFVDGYAEGIKEAYTSLPDADVIIFKMTNRPPSFPDKVQRLRFPKTMKVSSWQISFRRASLIKSGVRFDELMGAGSGNGAEEELKFLLDCQKKNLKIYYVPFEIASVAQNESTWFEGFDEKFFERRGGSTRYVLGFVLSSLYAVYYILAKRNMYRSDISPWGALKSTFKGILKNSITKQKKQK